MALLQRERNARNERIMTMTMMMMKMMLMIVAMTMMMITAGVMMMMMAMTMMKISRQNLAPLHRPDRRPSQWQHAGVGRCEPSSPSNPRCASLLCPPKFFL